MQIMLFSYLNVRSWILTFDPGLLGLSDCYEDEGCQGYLRVVATETTLEACTQKKKSSFKIKILKRKKSILLWIHSTSSFQFLHINLF